MTRGEQFLKKFHDDLAGRIYDLELEEAYSACLEKCENNAKPCPYGEAHSRANCIVCLEEYLNKEIED